MPLVDSLLGAIVRLDGNALVMHVREKPYVLTGSSLDPFRGPLSWGELAVNCYRQVIVDPYASQIAKKMLGWISYLKGNLEQGWPVYPVTSIDRVPLIEFLTGYLKLAFSNAIRVRKSARPWELKYLLKLKEWSPVSQPHAGVLIWFNFGSSIGGEILCGKLLGKFSDLNKDLRITCAIDARLIDLFKDTYPSIAFIPKKDSLPINQSQFDYFLLGKDLLGLIAAMWALTRARYAGRKDVNPVTGILDDW